VGTQVHKDLLALKEIAEQTRTLYLPPRFAPRTTESDAVSTDQQGLLSLQVSAQNRLKEIEGFKKPREDHKVERKKIEKLLSFLSALYEYRRLGKLLSTYTSFPTGSDGRVHSEWLIHGTATGRISSSEPNLMNIPKKELRVRKVFTAKEGHCFLSADWFEWSAINWVNSGKPRTGNPEPSLERGRCRDYLSTGMSAQYVV
jgi:DNA polymerase-1